MAADKVFSVDDVASHKDRTDLWVIIHGKVYDLTKYVRDHPGGADVLYDVAGVDATEAYDEVGHSEDADEILKTFLIGTVKDAHEIKAPKKVVRLIQSTTPKKESTAASGSSAGAITMVIGSIAGGAALYFASPHNFKLQNLLPKLPLPTVASLQSTPTIALPQGGFFTGFTAATSFCVTVGAVLAAKLSNFTQIESGFTKYPPHLKSQPMVKADPGLARGFLQPKEYQALPLVKKEQLSPSVFRFVYQLPKETDVIGIPIGQHCAIKANIDGKDVARSYTPTSNNTDLGRLELVIKCYPDGLLTGKYLANLKVGDKSLFRGPKGAMKYKKGLCKKIGMVAGGTGITPMYQLIRAICEDETDTTEVSLILANRSEEDILLRKELEAFANNYPKNFKFWYMLDKPPQNWAYGKGFITRDVMTAKLPAPSPDTKVMLCGPPGMVKAAQTALVSMGFQAPGAITKMTDQMFLF
ncbi:Cytochrome b5 [Penicillium expansum]|uniref:Cytochrome b5 n=1 Tax=Penicillium expansum TaxID=27334 RepID=A0A0A2KFT3_PENEN|nr:Cytochrome b5 [Penicillium expansum]KGO37481.1 Cytochrome b5 [Penicillium expansum]KGO50969.1 Cytochrome b5 [Penicillium expansum]KGO65813.1 Cytochrome b5 [Penicillium expansum]